MKDHRELKKLVIVKLEKFSVEGNLPTARELYYEIRAESPGAVIKGFKSFVRLIPSINRVEAMQPAKGQPCVYKLQK